jgi:prepilin peptidase CpaA
MSLMEIALLGFFPALMAVAAVSDLISMTISNRISLLLLAGFPLMAYVAGLPFETIGWHVLAGVAMLAVGFFFFAMGWIGGGDAKLMAATAVWFGWSHLFEYALLASFLGGALTLAIVCARRYALPLRLNQIDWIARLHDKKNGVPYGIALAAAALILYPNIQLWQAALAG